MFKTITSNFTKYICNNDGKKLAELFTTEGCYHDYIYGSFKGHNEINEMLSKLEVGTEVIAASGIIGKVKAIKGEYISIEVSENVVFKLPKELMNHEIAN